MGENSQNTSSFHFLPTLRPHSTDWRARQNVEEKHGRANQVLWCLPTVPIREMRVAFRKLVEYAGTFGRCTVSGLPSDVTYATRSSELRVTCGITSGLRIRSHTSVRSVARIFNREKISPRIEEATDHRDDTSALFVQRVSPQNNASTFMCARTQAKNPSSAKFARKTFRRRRA